MSADEIDAELLALAGDSSGDENDDLDQTQVIDRRSPSDEAELSHDEPQSAPSRLRGVAQKVKPRGRRRRKPQQDDDEAESSPSPARSAQSDGGLDSDGEIDTSPFEEVAPLFPVEGKFTSSADREYILSLPEIEREEILADRAQQVIHRQQDLQLKKALADTRAAANRNKRNAAAAELDDGNKRTTRPKSDRRTALDDYRRAREQKGAERSRSDHQPDSRGQGSPSPASDLDADGESEVEWAEPAAGARTDEPPADLKDFERCRVGRSNFSKVCFYPGFEEAIKGCFCRISIGINKETGQNQYRMTQIKGFTEGKPYHLENASGKRFVTDQYALVAQGSAEKPWPFSACSDGNFTDLELARFVESSQKDHLRQPSRKFLTNKLNDIHKLLNQVFTEETLQLKFAKQRAMERKHDPVYAAQRKREGIEKRRRAAEQADDLEEVARCDSELAELDNTTIPTSNGDLTPKPSVSMHMSQDKLAKLNATNRGKNIQEVRRALIEERRRLQRDREAATAQKEAVRKVQTAATEHQKSHDVAKPHSMIEKQSGLDAAKSKPRERQLPGALKKKNLDDDVIGSLDIGIDVDI